MKRSSDREEQTRPKKTKTASASLYPSPRKYNTEKGEHYIDFLNTNLKNETYYSSLFMIHYGVKVLQIVENGCQKTLDSLEHRRKLLAEEIGILEYAQQAFKDQKEENSIITKNLVGSKLMKFQIEQETLTNLMKKREDYNQKLLGAFPFAERGVLKTFLVHYNSEFKTNFTKSALVEELRNIITKIGDKKFDINNNHDKILKFFGINPELTDSQRYAVPCLRRLKDKVSACAQSKESSSTYVEKFGDIITLNQLQSNLGEATRTQDKKHIPVDDDHDRIFKFFEIETQRTKPQGYSLTTKNSLQAKIESYIGREPSSDEIKAYQKLHENYQNEENLEKIKGEVREYISKNSEDIVSTMSSISNYMLHHDFIEHIKSINFLEQVIIYKQLNRDLIKTILVQGDPDKSNLPPGINTTIKFTSGGTSNAKLHSLKTYTDIGQNNTETLRNYKEFFCGEKKGGIEEKEDAFKILHIIESVRSISAILTVPMFFELAKEEFNPFRKGKESYEFEKISSQMPMAMQGAVGAAAFLHSKIKHKIEGNIEYDYRVVTKDESEKGNILNNKNTNILFDYILYKSGLNSKTLKEVNSEVKKYVVNEDKNQKTHIKLMKPQNLPEKKLETAEKIQYEYDFTISGKQSEDQKVNFESVESFPLNIFTELMKKWYLQDSAVHSSQGGSGKAEIEEVTTEQYDFAELVGVVNMHIEPA